MSTPTANRRVHLDSATSEKAVATPSKTPARRVLGELTPNAKVSPQKSNITADKTQAPVNRSPLKQAYTAPVAHDENAYGISKLPSQMTGRKRSIDEVEGAVAREDATGTFAKRVDGRAEGSEYSNTPGPHIQTPATVTTPLIDLPEDLTPTDEDTPEPAPRNTQETTGTRASFSSLIDYNPHGSSQQTPSSPVPATKVSARTQAEILRLRLRVALYKVKTDQTYVPLSCLEIPRKYQRKPANEDLSEHASTEAEAPIVSHEHEDTTPVITVTDDKPSDTSDSSFPKLLPAPILRPTAYSTRFISEPYMPSSPPHSVAVEGTRTPRARGQNEFVTPVANRQTATQLSSPPGSEEQQNRPRAHTDSDSLTSSVVKGRAASGLLELMRSA